MHDFLTLKSKEMEVGGAPEVISVLPWATSKARRGSSTSTGRASPP